MNEINLQRLLPDGTPYGKGLEYHRRSATSFGDGVHKFFLRKASQPGTCVKFFLTAPQIPACFWSDEFDGTSIDTTKWDVDGGEYIQVSGGKIIITEPFAGVRLTNKAVFTGDCSFSVDITVSSVVRAFGIYFRNSNWDLLEIVYNAYDEILSFGPDWEDYDIRSFSPLSFTITLSRVGDTLEATVGDQTFVTTNSMVTTLTTFDIFVGSHDEGTLVEIETFYVTEGCPPV